MRQKNKLGFQQGLTDHKQVPELLSDVGFDRDLPVRRRSKGPEEVTAGV